MNNRARLPLMLSVLTMILLLAGIGLIGFAAPSAAAAVCPSCYGFRPAGEDVYVQQGVSPSEAETDRRAVDEGRRLVRAFWGQPQSHPRMLICRDNACFQRMKGGGRKGMSILDVVAVLSPRGLSPVIAAHEMSMAELIHRIGWMGFARQTVPVWFNEGVSMVASDDQRYLAPAGTGARCLVPAPALASLPAGPFEWNRRALTDDHLYAKAACATSRWIDGHGGHAAVVNLVAKVAAGTSFNEAIQ
ncbi:MAG: hypothetical protein JO171_03380 [Paludibacterium sp.]|uniref:hypothetical protein n=1 Tax=Paludibacterium sp. TaxID=1917523 RepID=UPI0025F764D4|nr:hypothetical protein [Paludibacterium sp.]MBV8046167.1 hypothetical protein [Paludibacterium sp.]MBV8648844.1 hypothetical protein [Paludibacterium sp.]